MILFLIFAQLQVDPQATGFGVDSLQGTYHIAVGMAPIELNQIFMMVVEVTRTDGAKIDKEKLSVDARMPAHRHGMTTRPYIQDMGGGKYKVEALLFHMPGHWELYFDITHQGRTERARVDFQME